MRIAEKWEQAEALPSNATVQALSKARKCGPVEIRYNRDANEVLVLFTNIGGHNLHLMTDLAKAVGERAAVNLRQSLMDGNLVAHIPVQTYVDNLGGEIPNLARARG